MKQLLSATCCSVYSRWLRALTLVMRKVHTGLRSTSWRLFQEYRVAKRRNQLFWREMRFRFLSVKAEFRLWGWYGRIGNNVQQLIIAIAHAEEFGGSTAMDEKRSRRHRWMASLIHLGMISRPIARPQRFITQSFFIILSTHLIAMT